MALRGRKGDKARRVGSAKREGVIVCDGQKVGRAWTIPEQNGWYSGGKKEGGVHVC